MGEAVLERCVVILSRITADRQRCSYILLMDRPERNEGAGREDSGIAEVYMGGGRIGTTEELGIITTTATMIFFCIPSPLSILFLLSSPSYTSYTVCPTFDAKQTRRAETAKFPIMVNRECRPGILHAKPARKLISRSLHQTNRFFTTTYRSALNGISSTHVLHLIISTLLVSRNLYNDLFIRTL